MNVSDERCFRAIEERIEEYEANREHDGDVLTNAAIQSLRQLQMRASSIPQHHEPNERLDMRVVPIRHGLQFLIWAYLKRSAGSIVIRNAAELLNKEVDSARLGFRFDVAENGDYTLTPEGEMEGV